MLVLRRATKNFGDKSLVDIGDLVIFSFLQQILMWQCLNNCAAQVFQTFTVPRLRIGLQKIKFQLKLIPRDLLGILIFLVF